MRRLTTVRVAILLALASAGVSSQAPSLTLVSSGPRGELTGLADAGEVRLVFSEPMVALGDTAVTGAPPWITIAPAIRGAFYWSGTRTLIFTPDPSEPVPYSTRFTVRIDRTAASATGRALNTPFEFSFTTPTVRLLSATWYRKSGLADSPVVVGLRFNQPVRPTDVAAHTRLRPTSHQWTRPTMTAEARARLTRTDPAGLARFDAKVAATARVAAGGGMPLEAVPAASWDENRFPPAPELVVLETKDVPLPEAWLAVTVDNGLTGVQGTETHVQQSTTIQLEQAFFVSPTCTIGCDPSGYNGVSFRRPVNRDALTRALSVRDVSDPRGERPIVAVNPPNPGSSTNISSYFSLQDPGFPRQPPDSTWLLSLDSSLTATDGQTLGYPWMAIVENVHEQAFMAFDGAVWESAAGPSIPVTSRNVTRARQWAVPVEPSQILARLRAMNMAPPSRPPVAAATMLPTTRPDAVEAQGLDLRNVLSSRGFGLVWAAVSLDEMTPGAFRPRGQVNQMRSTLVQVTNLGVSVKDSPSSTLVFVTRLDTGAPVAQANVAIAAGQGEIVWRGVTDRDGTATAPVLRLRSTDGSMPPAFVVTAERDGDVAYVASDWYGPQPFRWGLNYQSNAPADQLRGLVFTDRGAYRQGDDVHVKSVLRIEAPDGVRLVPAESRFDVIVRDPRGREIDKRTIGVNAWSSLEWTWPVPADGALGSYQITVRPTDAPATAWLQQANGSFLVAQYRRPDFRVDASLTSAPPVARSTLRGTVDARYLFGAGVASEPVRWRLTRTATQEVPRAIRQRFPEERYAFGYLAPPPPNTGPVIQVDTRTEMLDAGGHLAVDVAAAGDVDAAYNYSFEGDVESAGGQHIANRASLVVHPAPFYVGVKRLPFFVDTKTGAALEVVAAGLDGQTIAGVPIAITLLRQDWQWGAMSGPSGGPGWELKEMPAGDWSATTTEASPATLQIPLRDAGAYVVRATARDAAGRRTRTDVSFYAVGSGRSSWKVDGNRIELVPERKTWKPGESARVLIQSPWDRATALLTIEREGVRSHRQFVVTSTQDTVEVPITEADVPNVFVSVMLVKGRTSDELGPDGTDLGKPSYRVGYTELTVDDAAKRLNVTVSTDRETYRPKQPLTVNVSVANALGRPAAGEVTLWAVDYGLLSLTDYHTPDVVQAIYAHRPLGVMTQDNRERLMSRRVLARTRSVSIDEIFAQAGERSVQASTSIASTGGGSGGSMGAPVMAPSPATFLVPGQQGQAPTFDLRTDFRPVVFWLGSTTADADGRATTTVALPDSLTTYRVMAVAGDATSRFGWAEREITVSRPLTLLPEFPRFLSKGDRASFGAILTNSTDAAGEAVVTIRSLDSDVLAFGATDRQTLRLPRGATTPVHFEATARGSGTVRVQMTVSLGGETDAFETSLPVTVPARLETVAAYGETASRAVERVTLPAGLVPTAGGLSIELASTALVALGESARYLDEYPYTCAEQKASRALALLLTADLGGAFALADLKPADARAAAVGTLEDLYGYQCGDGGFTLWPGMCQASNAYLTAYVLHVYKVASALGVAVDQDRLGGALNFLQRQLRQPPPEIQWWPAWAASQAYAVKVLAEYGRNPRADITRLYGMADRLPVFATSYLADALAATGDRGPRYQNVVQRVANALRVEADRAHVEERDDASLVWLWNSNVRATAAVLDGFARRKDDATFVAPLVRWLVASRTNGRWGTTHENGAALEALVTYYRAFETETPNMTAAVAFDGRTVGTATFSGRSTIAQSMQLSMADLVRDAAGAAARDLVVSRAGTGRVFYTSRLQYLASEPPTMVERGMRVERRYQRVNASTPASPGTEFVADDVVRVTVTVTLPREGRYIALTDPLPAGFEAVDTNLRTTATDLAAEAATPNAGVNWLAWWRRGGFDHVEKHDDRVLAFATRLAAGPHEFSYLVRATTPGTFTAAGAQAEAMYAPEVKGRSTATVVEIR